MGEVTTQIDRDADLTVRTVRGPVTAQEILDAMAEFKAVGRTRLILWDFSQARLEHLTAGRGAGAGGGDGTVPGRAGEGEDGAGLFHDVRIRPGADVRPGAGGAGLARGLPVVPQSGGGDGVAGRGVSGRCD